MNACLQFEDHAGNVVYEQHASAAGDFHFVAEEEGEYKLCFTAADFHTAQASWQELALRQGVWVTQSHCAGKPESSRIDGQCSTVSGLA